MFINNPKLEWKCPWLCDVVIRGTNTFCSMPTTNCQGICLIFLPFLVAYKVIYIVSNLVDIIVI